MEIRINKQYESVVEIFFEKRPSVRYTISQDATHLILDIDTSSLSNREARQIERHLKYLDLFVWLHGGIEDVVFWERTDRFDDIVADFEALMGDLAFNFIAPIESRGFLLAGLLGKGLHLPIIPVRKYKPFFEQFPGTRVNYTNWKGKEESLFVFSKASYVGASVLVVDDLIETGNSLEAAINGLNTVGCEVVGAFYLCDVIDKRRRGDFAIPIRSFVKQVPESL